MRLIDADALREKAHKLPNGYNWGWFHKCVDEMIDTAHTVDVPERNVGEWIYYPKASGTVTSTAVYFYPVCSVCGCEHPVANYCPNCGARMKGEDDEHTN